MPMLRRVINIVILSLFTTSLLGQWGMFGSFDELSCNCSCTFEDAQYAYYNVGGATAARAYSYRDDNKVWLNSSSTILASDLDKQQGIEFSLSPFDSIISCQPLAISGEESAAGIVILDDTYRGKELITNVSRYGGLDVNILNLEATLSVVTISRNGIPQTSLFVAANDTASWTKTNDYTGVWSLSSTTDILAFKREDLAANGDPVPFVPPSTEIVGWVSTVAYISSYSASDLPFIVNSHLGTDSSTTSANYNIVNNVDCLLYTSPSPRDQRGSRMPSSA